MPQDNRNSQTKAALLNLPLAGIATPHIHRESMTWTQKHKQEKDPSIAMSNQEAGLSPEVPF